MKKTISLITGVFVLLVAVGIAFASAEAEGGHHGADWFGLFKKAFNFVVLMGLLYWLLAAKVKEFFVGRRAEIKENLEKAVERKAEAEKKYREYSEKIDKASTEIDGIIEMIKAQGVVEKQQIIVMPGLLPGIHVLFACRKTWMAGTNPAMTENESISVRLSG